MWETGACCKRMPLEVQKQTSTTTTATDVKPITCFVCREVGHKSPQCLKCNREKVRKVTIQADKIERLATNDVMAMINEVRIHMTIDSGAEVSIVPLELVKPEELTGDSTKCKGSFDKQTWTDAKIAHVTITISTESLQTKVLSVPADDLGWIALLSVDMGDSEQMARVTKLVQEKNKLSEQEIQYLPPHHSEGKVQGAVLVCEGEVVEKPVEVEPFKEVAVEEDADGSKE